MALKPPAGATTAAASQGGLPTGGTQGQVLTAQSDGTSAWALPEVTQAELDAETSSRLSGDSQLVSRTLTASGTLIVSDAGKLIESNSSSAITATIPASVFPTGCVIELLRFGTGTFTIAAGSGITLLSDSGQTQIAVQYGQASLWQRTSGVFVLSGALG